MYSRFTFATIVLAAVGIGVVCGRRSAAIANPPTDSTTQPLTPPVHEFRVMSLADMFGNTEGGMKRVAELMVQTPGAVNRVDMNSGDYQEALNRLAGEGWEIVTVNKSNYWVFRRLKVLTRG